MTISAGGVFNGQAPPTIQNRILNTLLIQPTYAPLAHGGGAIHGRIAGNVTDSIISVSVDPESLGGHPSRQPRAVPAQDQPDLPVRSAREHRPAPRHHQREGRRHDQQQRTSERHIPACGSQHFGEFRLLRQPHEGRRRAGCAPERSPGPVSVAGGLSQRPAVPEGALQARQLGADTEARLTGKVGRQRSVTGRSGRYRAGSNPPGSGWCGPPRRRGREPRPGLLPAR